MVLIKTLDGMHPWATTNLAASVESTQQEVALTVSASGEADATTVKAKAVDGVTTTYWSTPGRTTMQDEYIAVDTGAVRSIGRVKLLSRPSRFLFPEDLPVELSSDNVSFTTSAQRTGLPSTQGLRHTIDFTPSQGRYVRIYITKTRLSGGGLYYARIAEIDVFETTFTGAVQLSWTAPGDERECGDSGVLRREERRLRSRRKGAFQSATSVSGEPLPQGAGAANPSLSPDCSSGTHYFAMKTTDEAANVSGLSNSSSVTIP